MALDFPEEEEALLERPATARRAIDELVGEISADEVLDEIFGSFCIGK